MFLRDGVELIADLIPVRELLGIAPGAIRQCASMARLVRQLSDSAIVIKVLTLSLEMGYWC